MGTSGGTPASVLALAYVPTMAESPEEFAYELSRATFENQAETGKRLRERAASLLSAASVVMPVAGIAIGKGPGWVAVPFVLAAVAYGACAYFCALALLPKKFGPGIAGGAFLELARENGANLDQMHASAATYLDQAREENSSNVSESGDRVEVAIRWLVVELLLLALSLGGTIIA
jgi:hypothetical protein